MLQAIVLSILSRLRRVLQIEGVVQSFVDAARRAVTAGFEVIELHGAHGYLLHVRLLAAL